MDLGKMEVIRQIPQLLSDAIAATETLQRDDTDGFETSRKLALQAVDRLSAALTTPEETILHQSFEVGFLHTGKTEHFSNKILITRYHR